jgi:hypothetical protein
LNNDCKDTDILEDISKKIDVLAVKLEKSKIDEYMNYLENPKKLILPNFLAGVARGFGMLIGFALLGAFAIYILQRIVELNLPGIGKFISDIVDIVQQNLKNR